MQKVQKRGLTKVTTVKVGEGVVTKKSSLPFKIAAAVNWKTKLQKIAFFEIFAAVWLTRYYMVKYTLK